MLKVLASRAPGATIAELANEFHVSLKTVRRDLDVLRLAGFPLEETAGEFNRKSWRLQPMAAKFDLAFHYDEALALSFSQRFLEPLAGTYFGDAVQRAFRKIRASVGKNVLLYLDKMSGVLQQTMRGVGDYSCKAEIIDELMVGIEDQKVVLITYQSAQATEPTTYAIHPYGMMYHRGSPYLVGFAPRHGELRHWKIDRVSRAERSDATFERPEEFDLQTHFAQSFGIYHGDRQITVRIRFAPNVARFVTESTWHPSQRLTPQPDGGLLAEFELSSTVEIKSWALSFGAAAEVLEPTELRTEIADDLRRLLATYSATPTRPPTNRRNKDPSVRKISAAKPKPLRANDRRKKMAIIRTTIIKESNLGTDTVPSCRSVCCYLVLLIDDLIVVSLGGILFFEMYYPSAI